MKKLIILGVIGVILVGLIGFWVYSFLYGDPNNTDNNLFTNLGIFGQDSSVPVITPEVITEEEPLIDVKSTGLRQLTTKPVVGMRIINSKDNQIMRYVEAGTGHIFDINLDNGSEQRVSQISVPVASEAVISQNGDYIAIRSGYNNDNDVILIDLTDINTPTSIKIPNQIESFSFAFNNELIFTEVAGGQTEGKGYLPSTKQTRRLFSVPFTATEMSWSESSSTPHIIYTRPTKDLTGYAYEILASNIKRLPFSGAGLAVKQNASNIIIGRYQDNSYTIQIYDKANRSYSKPLAGTMTDKCVFKNDNGSDIYCATPSTLTSQNLPDDWYKGAVSLDDKLWLTGANSDSLFLSYPLNDIGRSIDVVSLKIDNLTKNIYFINKNDRTLWMFVQ